MKKMLIFACLFTTLIHSMKSENVVSLVNMTQYSLTLKCNKTYIHLVKGQLSNVEERENQTVIVGANQQGWSSGKFSFSTKNHFPENTVGSLENQYLSDYYNLHHNGIGLFGVKSYPNTHYLYENDDSDSDDDTYKPYTRAPLSYGFSKSTYPSKDLSKMSRKTTSSHVVMITEPCIKQAIFDYNSYDKNNDLIYVYDSYRSVDDGDDIYDAEQTFHGDEAIQEASKDLKLCYKTILSYKYYKDEFRPEQPNTINIVIPALSTDTGFPRDKAAPIAVAAILKNLKKNTFNNITLVVTKRSDYTLYKKLLMPHVKKTSKYYQMFEF